MVKKFSLVSLALAGLLALGGCDLFEDEDVGAGEAAASSDYSGFYGGTLNTITGVITSMTLHQDSAATLTGPSPVTVICSNGVALTGNISANRIVAYGTDCLGNRVRIVATFSGVYMDGYWVDTAHREFTMQKW